MRRVLLTGGAGFIGSQLVRCLLAEEGLEKLVNLDLLTYAGNPDNLAGIAGSRYRFVRGDIRDGALVEELFEEHGFDTVINCAAESHVDRSIAVPQGFVTTNVVGTQVLLEAARSYWSLAPGDSRCREYRPGVRYLQVSTDEVYGALGREGKFCEESPLAPSSPYSAAKAGADLLVQAYWRTYGLPVCITRCSNNYGPRQFPEKLIPRMILLAGQERPLPIYGSGLQVRDWIHVEDHCAGILTVLRRGRPGEVYNLGGDSERTNLEIERLILEELGKPESLLAHVEDRPGHDWRYAMDHGKITGELGWAPAVPFEAGMRETIRWYVEHPAWTERILSGEYRQGI